VNEAKTGRWTPLRIAGAIAAVIFVAAGALILWVLVSFVACVSSDSCLHF